MGVPALFRWLSQKYPKIAFTASEAPTSLSSPNPNGFEIDNLYLDMNGIIHPCCHPTDKAAPTTQAEMFREIFLYIDRILKIVRPRKVLYMAIDGVAPRAKMNQQRSRRFRAAKEAEATRLKEVADGEAKKEAAFDSNCITPGTPFMNELAKALRYYVTDRYGSEEGWSQFKVVLSDASVPGEGEHKIMDYIRAQRNQTGYNPNTSHVLYGLDADLIMLALATHEPYFKILREDVTFDARHEVDPHATRPYVFLHCNILREYLAVELRPSFMPSFSWDIERAIDDWIFFIFFVGNDFLPHLPSLEIREGAIEMLVEIYKRQLCQWGGYLTENGNVSLERVSMLLTEVGKREDDIFRKRKDREERFEANKKRREEEADRRKAVPVAHPDLEAFRVKGEEEVSAFANKLLVDDRRARREENMRAAESLRKRKFVKVEQDDDQPKKQIVLETEESAAVLEDENLVVIELEEEEAEKVPEEVADDVRLWEPGFKERYYRNKFGIELSDMEFRKKVVRSYVEGFSWVLQYYYQGCQSWKWYYPYHYSPFASDFADIADLNIEFELGEPFNPLEQLMGVLPAASRSHIPVDFHDLMTDSYSEIIDFYPSEFQIDLNGKKFAWQGVVILPFIEEDRLLKAMGSVYEKLDDYAKILNSRGTEILFANDKHTLFDQMCLIYGKEAKDKLTIDYKKSDNLFGDLIPDPDVTIPGCRLESPLAYELKEFEDVTATCISACFNLPPKDKISLARLLPGVILPKPLLNREDKEFVANGGHNNRRNERTDRYGQSYAPQHPNNAGYGEVYGERTQQRRNAPPVVERSYRRDEYVERNNSYSRNSHSSCSQNNYGQNQGYRETNYRNRDSDSSYNRPPSRYADQFSGSRGNYSPTQGRYGQTYTSPNDQNDRYARAETDYYPPSQSRAYGVRKPKSPNDSHRPPTNPYDRPNPSRQNPYGNR